MSDTRTWNKDLEPRPGDLVHDWRKKVREFSEGSFSCVDTETPHSYWGFNGRIDVGFVMCLRCGFAPNQVIRPSALVNKKELEEDIVEHPLPKGVEPMAAFPVPGFDPLRDRSQDDKPPSVEYHPEELYDDLPPQAQRIVEEIIPGVMDRFIAKNRGYQLSGENLAEILGAKGQWGDLFRKIMVTKAVLWDGEPEMDMQVEAGEMEGTEERLEDIVGHALLAIDMLRQGNRG